MTSRFTRHETPDIDAPLLRQANTLVGQARDSEVSQRAPLLNHAGALFREAGAHPRAMQAFGMAIDSLTECDRLDAAIAQCRRILRLSPSVVRARCTLTFLLAERGDVEEAAAEMERYVEAARRAGVTEIAVRRLRLLSAHPTASRIASAVDRAFVALGAERRTPELADGLPLAVLLRAEPESLRSLLASPLRLMEDCAAPDLPWLDTALERRP